MRQLKAIGRELAAALAVIAVFALTFIYQPFMPALTHQSVQAQLQSSFVSLCGGGSADDHQENQGPCHACRSKVAVLPPPPEEAVPAFIGSIAVSFACRRQGVPRFVFETHYNPRAPPFAV